ncbi:unnamed protein product [Strongylus vulgaris]|uniref:Uncharacterized protein n=1 Tax=Strongylus vulgaris TaxID=40348 RepID=A0A3P7J6B4_STRVU|nr:unnamed protein product [Strongylus vulgaris]
MAISLNKLECIPLYEWPHIILLFMKNPHFAIVFLLVEAEFPQ